MAGGRRAGRPGIPDGYRMSASGFLLRDSPDSHRIFVYGTLMRGEPNHRLLSHARFLGPARTRPAYTLVDLGAFPGLLARGNTRVQGEIYEVDDRTRAALDRLEGHPTFYRRQRVRLETSLAAEAYVLPAAQYHDRPTINSGSWRAAARLRLRKEEET